MQMSLLFASDRVMFVLQFLSLCFVVVCLLSLDSGVMLYCIHNKCVVHHSNRLGGTKRGTVYWVVKSVMYHHAALY